jgi:Spy/CpxP family protein refolding chaperone
MKDRPRALSVLVAVFLAGIVIGATGSYYWFKFPAEAERPFDGRRPAPPPPSNTQERLTFSQILDLTPEQDQQFKQIFEETRRKLEELRQAQEEERYQKIEAIWTETNPKLRAVLDEEQKVKFNDFLARMHDWREKAPKRERPEPPNENRRKPARP